MSRRFYVTKTGVTDAEWAPEFNAVILALESGEALFFNVKGKVRNLVLTVKVGNEPITKILWPKHVEGCPYLLISLTRSGSIKSFAYNSRE